MMKLTLKALRGVKKDQDYERCLAFVADPDNWLFKSELDTFLPFEYAYIDLKKYTKYKRRLAAEFGYLYVRNDENDPFMALVETSGTTRLDDKHWPFVRQDSVTYNLKEGDRYIDGWHNTLPSGLVRTMAEKMGFKVAFINSANKEMTIIRPKGMDSTSTCSE